MNTAIDHIILASANLQSLTQEVKATARVEPAIGGRLLGQGVKNNLLGLGEGQYLELLGPDPEQEEVEQPLFGLDALEAPRIIGWAVRT
ncbi:MAG TPA: VOC family protein, partial [Actinomycetales bacterium]|nr:VOC family protein [Actinomycetales bacterium]